MKRLLLGLWLLSLAGCGIVYVKPEVRRDVPGVRVLDITAASIAVANRGAASPAGLPAAFYQTAGGGHLGAGGVAVPPIPGTPEVAQDPGPTRLPPEPPDLPYLIGIGDILRIAVPREDGITDIAALSTAQSLREDYTVQDDGAIALPNVGRVQVAGRTIDQAEDMVFQRLVEQQIDPTFSLEVVAFNSRRVSVGGAVTQPAVVTIGLTPLFLDEALAGAGGISARDIDQATVRIYREGQLYSVPAERLYSNRALAQIRLVPGDAVYVDAGYDLDRAQEFFAAQIQAANLRAGARAQALNALSSQVAIVRGQLQDERSNFQARRELGAETAGFVFLAGEVVRQGRFELPYGRIAHLADALYSENGVPTATGNPAEIYVIRATADPAAPVPITAWRLDASNAVNLVLATRFRLRPDDVVFVAEQPVTSFNRVISGLTPTLGLASTAAAIAD